MIKTYKFWLNKMVKKIFVFLLFLLAIAIAIVILVNNSRNNAPSESKAATAPFSVGFAGDFGISTAKTVFQAIGKNNPTFFMSLGDLSYNTSSAFPEIQWCQMVKDNINLGAGKAVGNTYGEIYPFEMVTGDHEDGFDAQDGFIDTFVASNCLPNRLTNAVVAPIGKYGRGTYYIDYPAQAPIARFLELSPIMHFPDTTYTFTKGDAYYNWASQAIDDARAKGIKWIVVSNHENFITMGIKGNGIGADFFNLMVEKKVDLIFEGNDHNYQRGKQLAFNGTTCKAFVGAKDPVNSACIVDDGSDNAYVKGKGTILIINGTGGINHYDTNPSDPEAGYFAKWMGNTTAEISFGYTNVTFTDQSATATFVNATGGNFADSFTISDTGGSVTCDSFTYSPWSACSGGTQTRTVTSASPAGCTGGTPVTSQTCTVGVCGDGVIQTPNNSGANEVCDDSNTVNFDQCSSDCLHKCDGTSSQCQKMFIPGYFYPGALWDQAIASASKIEGLIMNPGNGPGTASNSTYVTYVNKAKQGGLKIYGYVYSSYGARAASEVKADIDRYKTWYGVTDIFVDEAASSATSIPYYQDLANYVHQTSGAKIALNPGTNVDEGYVAFTDIIMNFEGTFATYQNATFPSWITKYPASKFVHMVYATSLTQVDQAVGLSKLRNAGLVYVTDDGGTNPWDTLPTYMTSEVSQLCTAGTASLDYWDGTKCVSGSGTTTCGAMDVNGDGKLTIIDLAAFAKLYKTSCSASTGTLSCGSKDSNGDGKIDIIDLSAFASEYLLTSCIR